MSEDDTADASTPSYRGSVNGRTLAASPPPRIEANSIYPALGRAVELSGGVVLRDLDDEAPVPELKLGASKYQILSELGAGGMGIVYLAYDQDLKRRVALKVVKALERELAHRFVEEAQVMAQLQHPYIVPVFEVGLADGQRPYYTMPVVRGRALRDVLADLADGDVAVMREYSLARRLQIFVQVCRAVGYAHAKGVVHRDLKPGNVMLGRHGEVQVMDWGLSKVLREGGLAPSAESGSHRAGGESDPLVGTPGYMAPEQIEGTGSDHRTDIYALGAILYELLTLTWPFNGTITEVIGAHLNAEPEPPSRRAGEREVPREIEAVCSWALRKRREERPQSVDAMRVEVQRWLEAESDRARRHELAEAKAAEGRVLLDAYRLAKSEVARLEDLAVQVAARFESWQAAGEKEELFAAEDRVREAERAVARSASTTVNVLGDALAFEETNATARALLADYYWDRLGEAEAERNERDIDFFTDLVRRYHGGKYARELEGDGSLQLESEPSGAEVWLYDLVERGPARVAENERHVDASPGRPLRLAMGSYLAIVRSGGFADARYPVHIARCTDWAGAVRMFAPSEIGDGFVHVPAGRFIQGGDPLPHRSLPRSEPWVDDFFIAIHPVTIGEYLDYLNDVARRDGLEVACRRAPRPSPDAPTYFVADGVGGLVLPKVDPSGVPWHRRLPLIGVSWHDANAYCAWRTEVDGRPCRLPTESEWEKAARGVDGRLYPWGDRFDPSLCNMRESRRERPSVVPVDDFPSDVSVYGVRGMGGNVQDWTATATVEGTAKRLGRVARGGAWLYSRTNPRVACRSVYTPSSVLEMVGFRLAIDAP